MIIIFILFWILSSYYINIIFFLEKSSYIITEWLNLYNLWTNSNLLKFFYTIIIATNFKYFRYILIVYFLDLNLFFFKYFIFLLEIDNNFQNSLLINTLNKIHPMLFHLSLWSIFYISYNIICKNKINLINYFYLIWIAIILGSWWAYQEGNWGGWWDWDPSEVFSLFILIFYLLITHYKYHNNFFFNKKLILFFLIKTILLFYLILQLNFFLSNHNFGNFFFLFFNNFFFNFSILITFIWLVLLLINFCRIYLIWRIYNFFNTLVFLVWIIFLLFSFKKWNYLSLNFTPIYFLILIKFMHFFLLIIITVLINTSFNTYKYTINISILLIKLSVLFNALSKKNTVLIHLLMLLVMTILIYNFSHINYEIFLNNYSIRTFNYKFESNLVYLFFSNYTGFIKIFFYNSFYPNLINMDNTNKFLNNFFYINLIEESFSITLIFIYFFIFYTFYLILISLIVIYKINLYI